MRRRMISGGPSSTFETLGLGTMATQNVNAVAISGGTISGTVITELFTTATNPAENAATAKAIVDAYNGVMITLSTTGNSQTLATPTAATVKIFTIVNNDTSNNNVTAIANSISFTITPGEAKSFIFDGSAWGPTDLGITAIPVTVPQGGTGLTTVTAGAIPLGAGTSALSLLAATAESDFVVSGASPFAWVKKTLAETKTILSWLLSSTAEAIGFTISGGTTSKTLTVSETTTLNGGTQSGTNTGDVTLATNHGLGLTNQVLNMGTPSSVTGVSTNSVTTTTHTHALDMTAPPAIGGTTPAAITGSSITVKSADPQYNLKDSSCADSDVNAQIAAEATTTTSGAENIDLIMRAQIAGVLTEVNRFDASDNQWEPAKPFVFGLLDLGTDTGAVTLADKTVTSSAATTDESYMLKIDGNPALTVYAESDGAGGIQKARLVFAYPIAPSNESIQSASEGVAASLTKDVTYITTNGDEDLDNITLADGVFVGQRKEFAVKAVGHANDSVKITPATMVGGTQITFAASPLGLGCHMSWSSAGWVVTANNGGTIA